MPVAAILLHVDASDAKRRTAVALGLAARFDATVIGMAALAPRPHFVAEGVIIDPKLTEDDIDRMRAELDQRGARFRALATGTRERLEWRSVIDLPADAIAREARAADLVIVGRDYDPLDPYRSLDPGAVILKAGRPVLVVPSSLDQLACEHVLIAWKDTREARRVVMDGLPLLKAARRVSIAEICESNTESECQASIDDLERYLLRHGVAIEEKIVAHATRSTVDELLRIAKDDRADLIVAGGYGHSRLGEWVFGGVTEGLLAHSEICCLFSH